MFADTLETIWQSRHDYERRVTEVRRSWSPPAIAASRASS
jgi:hypothetical protein